MLVRDRSGCQHNGRAEPPDHASELNRVSSLGLEARVTVELDQVQRRAEISAPCRHSCSRSWGVPWLADSPREQTIRWARRPSRTSRATTPPQPNSTSSGWAPKAIRAACSGREFDIGFIGPIDGVADDVSDLRRVVLAEVVLLAGTCHVVSAVDH